MRTDELIARLAERPFARPSPARVLATALALGGAVSLVLMLGWLHLRPDLAEAVATSAFWMKLAYAAAMAAIAFYLAQRLSRPTGAAGRNAFLVAIPLVLIATIAAFELASADESSRMHLLLGNSWNLCTMRIVALSLPVFAAVLLFYRRLAPTRLAAAGFFAGLLAGAVGTIIYAFHCDESAAPFVTVWYTLGMAAIAGLGGALGRVLLRW